MRVREDCKRILVGRGRRMQGVGGGISALEERLCSRDRVFVQ